MFLSLSNLYLMPSCMAHKTSFSSDRQSPAKLSLPCQDPAPIDRKLFFHPHTSSVVEQLHRQAGEALPPQQVDRKMAVVVDKKVVAAAMVLVLSVEQTINLAHANDDDRAQKPVLAPTPTKKTSELQRTTQFSSLFPPFGLFSPVD